VLVDERSLHSRALSSAASSVSAQLASV